MRDYIQIILAAAESIKNAQTSLRFQYVQIISATLNESNKKQTGDVFFSVELVVGQIKVGNNTTLWSMVRTSLWTI